MARPIDLPAIITFALYIVYLFWLHIRKRISLDTMAPNVLLINFILPALNRDKYPNLVWYDSEMKLFVIKKKHAGNTNYSSEFDRIYKDWETVVTRKKNNTDKKQRLFAALKKSPSFEEVEELCTKENRVYRIIPRTATRGIGRSTNERRGVAAASIHSESPSPSFSEIAQISEASFEDTDQRSPASSVGEPLQWIVVHILPVGSHANNAVETSQQIVPPSEAGLNQFHNWRMEGLQLPAECQAFLEVVDEVTTSGSTNESADSMDTVALADHSAYLPDNGQQEMHSPKNALAVCPSVSLHRDKDTGQICDVSGVSNKWSQEKNLEEPEHNRQTVSSEEDLENLMSLLHPEELLDFCSESPVDTGSGQCSDTPVPDELETSNTVDLLEYLGYWNSASQLLGQEQSLDDALLCQDLGLLPDGRALDSFMDFEETLDQ